MSVDMVQNADLSLVGDAKEATASSAILVDDDATQIALPEKETTAAASSGAWGQCKRYAAEGRRKRESAEASSGGAAAKNDWTCLFLDRLASDPDVAQIVATTGGLVTYWNDAFAGITRSPDSLRSYPITIFELIESTSLGSFYGMLALALEGMPRAPSIVSNTARDETDSDEEGEEDEGPSHLSITLPCRRFHGSDVQYNITIIYMDDRASQCFIGILTPMPAPSPPNYISFRVKRRRVSTIEDSAIQPSTNQNTYWDSYDDGELPIVRGGPVRARRLPSGQMLRLYDEVLCQMIFGYQ